MDDYYILCHREIEGKYNENVKNIIENICHSTSSIIIYNIKLLKLLKYFYVNFI